MFFRTLVAGLALLSTSIDETPMTFQNTMIAVTRIQPITELPKIATVNANRALAAAKSNGIKRPEYLLGLLHVETKIGSHPGFRVTKNGPSTYYGIGQFTIATAEEVAKKNNIGYRDKWSLAKRLATDDTFAIDMSAKYLMMLGVNRAPLHAVTAYNLGPGGARGVVPMQHKYTRDVFSQAKRLANNVKVFYINAAKRSYRASNR
jgi:hypothetical protein